MHRIGRFAGMRTVNNDHRIIRCHFRSDMDIVAVDRGDCDHEIGKIWWRHLMHLPDVIMCGGVIEMYAMVEWRIRNRLDGLLLGAGCREGEQE